MELLGHNFQIIRKIDIWKHVYKIIIFVDEFGFELNLGHFFLLNFLPGLEFPDDIGCVLRLGHTFSIFFFSCFAIEGGRWSDLVGFI